MAAASWVMASPARFAAAERAHAIGPAVGPPARSAHHACHRRCSAWTAQPRPAPAARRDVPPVVASHPGWRSMTGPRRGAGSDPFRARFDRSWSPRCPARLPPHREPVGRAAARAADRPAGRLQGCRAPLPTAEDLPAVLPPSTPRPGAGAGRAAGRVGAVRRGSSTTGLSTVRTGRIRHGASPHAPPHAPRPAPSCWTARPTRAGGRSAWCRTGTSAWSGPIRSSRPYRSCWPGSTRCARSRSSAARPPRATSSCSGSRACTGHGLSSSCSSRREVRQRYPNLVRHPYLWQPRPYQPPSAGSFVVTMSMTW